MRISPYRIAAALASLTPLALAACGPARGQPFDLSNWADDLGAAGPEVTLQGALVPTDIPTELALEGAGFFILSGKSADLDGALYTRRGVFVQDAYGYLVTPSGLRVQGYQADLHGDLAGAPLDDLAIGGGTRELSFPRATRTISLHLNLGADSPVLTGTFELVNPVTTANFSTGVSIFDEAGGEHQLSIYFRKKSASSWEWHALVEGGETQGGTPGVPSEITAGTLEFTSGLLASATQGPTNFWPVGRGGPQALALWFGQPLDGSVTSLLTDSAVSLTSQDGFASGQLEEVQLDTKGDVLGHYTNGTSRLLGRVAVARAPAPAFLERVCGHFLLETARSGVPVAGAAATEGRGAIAGGFLEALPSELARCGRP
jgi:flagellar hook protein FlgE